MAKTWKNVSEWWHPDNLQSNKLYGFGSFCFYEFRWQARWHVQMNRSVYLLRTAIDSEWLCCRLFYFWRWLYMAFHFRHMIWVIVVMNRDKKKNRSWVFMYVLYCICCCSKDQLRNEIVVVFSWVTNPKIISHI